MLLKTKQKTAFREIGGFFVSFLLEAISSFTLQSFYFQRKNKKDLRFKLG
jgi:hypothetical protein